MKIYTKKPDSIIRISIFQQGFKREYLTLCEASFEQVFTYLKALIEGQHLSIFETGKKTSITVREASGSKNGKSINLSFRGLTPKETLDLITNDLNDKK